MTTSADLTRFFGCLKTQNFLSEAAHQFLWQSVSRISELSFYGHGFYLTDIGHERWPGHTGSDPGISARVAFSLKSDSCIILLCNSGETAFQSFRLATDYFNTLESKTWES